MLVGDAIAAALPELRAQAESLMRDTCSVSRVTGAAIVDEREVPATAAVYAGRCKVQELANVETSPDVAGATVTVLRYRLDLPVSAGPFKVGDIATVGARTFRITSMHVKTWQTAQRLPVDEVL